MQPVTADDVYRHRSLSGLNGSLQHGRAVLQVSQASRDENDYRKTAWLIDTGGEGKPRARRMTSPDFKASSLLVDEAGERMAFTSKRGSDSHMQAYVMRFDGGEAEAVTDCPQGMGSLLDWSPDGRHLLALQTVKWKEDDLDDTDADSRPIVATFLPYKMDGVGIKAGRRTRLVRIEVDSGDVQALVEGDFDVVDATWSPDGDTLAYSRRRSGLERQQADLWIADADGGNARQVTDDLYSVGGLQFSPDGRSIAFAAGAIEGDSRLGLYVHRIEDGTTCNLAGEDFQVHGSSIFWDAEGRRLATVRALRGLLEISIVDARTGGARRIRNGLRHVRGLVASGDSLVYAATSMRRLDEVYRVGWDGAGACRLTSFNRWFRERVRPRVSKRRFRVPDGQGGTERIDAWVLLPPEGEGPFPLMVDMHGGPQSIALINFARQVCWYGLLGKGFAVVAPNPVGSGSYGMEFARRLIGHWGEYDLPQIEAVVQQLRDEGLADGRIGCYGKSYGGYLSAWTATRSDTFMAAVVSAPVADMRSHAGTSDTGYYVTPYSMGAEVYEDPPLYTRLSPDDYAVRTDTATLLLQGRDDQRCPVGQSEELFAAMITAGHKRVKMVVYPGESHKLVSTGKPSHRVDYHQRVVDWIERYVVADDTGQQSGSS